jgi:hypothetical protein
MRTAILASLVLTIAFSANPARADDGYCDFVKGVADAEAAILIAPEVFTQFGKLEQASTSLQPAVDPGNIRFIGGLRWRISGVYEGVAVRDRAKAECRRHTALEQIRGEVLYRALAARARVIDDALPEAERLLGQVSADLDARRTTAQEATATRLRVEELRRISTELHDALGTLPRPTGAPLGLVAFQRADDDVERHEAKLRRARAFDITVRVGVDEFLNDSGTNTSSPYFALVTASLNLGILFQGGANARAADGRRTFVRSGRDPLSVDATADRLRALADTATRRAQETATLEADLEKQYQVLTRVGGDDSRRYRQIVWFDLVKVRAERAYHEAHAAALQQVIGGRP